MEEEKKEETICEIVYKDYDDENVSVHIDGNGQHLAEGLYYIMRNLLEEGMPESLLLMCTSNAIQAERKAKEGK